MRRKYTKELLESMSIFSRMTGAAVRDCFESEGVMHFVVEQGEIGKAIGKGGSVIKEMQQKLQTRIKVIEYSPSKLDFVKNVIYPLRVDDVTDEEGVIFLHSNDRNTKGLLIGRNAKNLNMLKDVVRRYFEFEDIKIK